MDFESRCSEIIDLRTMSLLTIPSTLPPSPKGRAFAENSWKYPITLPIDISLFRRGSFLANLPTDRAFENLSGLSEPVLDIVLLSAIP